MSLDTVVRSNRNDRDHWVHPEEHPCVEISIHSVKFFVLIFQRLFKNEGEDTQVDRERGQVSNDLNRRADVIGLDLNR